MRIRCSHLVVSASVLLLLVSMLHGADVRLQLPESLLRASIESDRITVAGTVVNAGATSALAHVRFELLDPGDGLEAVGFKELATKPGRNRFLVELELRAPGAPDKSYLWHRIRYEVGLRGSAPTRQGVVALGAITPDLFDLRIFHPPRGADGGKYLVRVHAANPVTRTPVAGVEVTGNVSFDDEAGVPLVARGATNAAGDALLGFQLPKTLNLDEGTLEVAAQRQGQVRTAKFDVELARDMKLIISTDKPLYQPGQKLHVRALLFGAHRRAVAESPVEFTLRNPESEVVFRGSATTNRFGIASIDWELPESLRLGMYHLEAEYQGEREYQNDRNSVPVRISRYDLPNFTLSASLDRPFYLSGQNARLQVSAKYLFGKPVTRGAVRVVRETERRWDYKAQKWETTEAEAYTAELDPKGQASLQLDLTRIQDGFSDEPYRPFRDFSFAAFVTDASTGRTEQRRFPLRLSHNPIHVNVAGARLSGNALTFYLVTVYADGTPARCHVRISEIAEDEEDSKPAVATGEQFLRSVKTNRYGVAKVGDLLIRAGGNSSHSMKLLFEARDARGAESRHVEAVWTERRDFDVSTSKAVYREKEPIEVSVRAAAPAGVRIVVEIVREGSVLRSQTARLHKGRAFLVFPYEPQFQGELTLVAYAPGVAEAGVPGAHVVLYPRDTQLKIKLQPARASHRPGDQFTAILRVSSPTGVSRRSALGVVALDKAVEERARTDQDFGLGSSFWDWSLLSDPLAIGGVSRADLDRLDMSQPLPAGLDLLAEILLNASPAAYRVHHPVVESDDYAKKARKLFGKRMKTQFAPISRALGKDDTPGWAFPTTERELFDFLKKNRIDVAGLSDPWGSRYRFEFGVEGKYRTISVASAGPDKLFDTSDDIPAEDYLWEYFEPIGKIIDRAVKEAHARSGGYVRDEQSLRSELLRFNVDWDSLRDPWGNPYRLGFSVGASKYLITAYSKRAGAVPGGRASDIAVWTSSIDYFAEARSNLSTVLAQWNKKTGAFPRSDSELKAALDEARFRLDELRDPWDGSYYATFRRTSTYGNRVVVDYEPGKQVQSAAPVTRMIDWIYIWSCGADGERGTADDFVVASLSQIVYEQAGGDAKPQPVSSVPLPASTGAIQGTVTDVTGAVIPGQK